VLEERLTNGREAVDPAILQPVRYVSYRYDTTAPAALVGRLPSHVANNHLTPGTEDVAQA